MQKIPFDSAALQELCDDGAWRRGVLLQRQGAVRLLEVAAQDDDEAQWQVVGLVQGSQRTPYQVGVEMEVLPGGEVDVFESHCTCPVGFDCKHGVALALEARHTGLPVFSAQDLLARVGRLTPTQQMQAEQKEMLLLHWLRELERANTQAMAPAPLQPKERHEQYLYLLSVSEDPATVSTLRLQVVTSYVKRDGAWAKPKPLSAQPAVGQPAYDRASDFERTLLQLVNALPSWRSASAYYYYGSSNSDLLHVLPQGNVGLQVLQQAASTGRLLFSANAQLSDTPLQWGQALALEWTWKSVAAPGNAGKSTSAQAHSNWSLRPLLKPASAKLCLNNPPLYVDATKALCGPVDSASLGSAQLQALCRAPTLSSETLKKYHTELAQQLGPVPLPPVLQSLERIVGQAPVARLHLAPTPAHQRADLGLITAQLRFDYQGCVGWWLTEPLSVMVYSPQGKQLLLQRDGRAELDAIDRLFALGLQGMEGGAFCIPAFDSQQPWLQWADADFAPLREANFALTIDAALDGWITHAETLDVRLQPTGDGSEADTSPWFDLSLGIEINGQRRNILSLLPDLIDAAAAYPLDPATGLPALPPYVYLAVPDSSDGGSGSGSSGFVRLPTEALRPWLAALLELVGDKSHDFSGDQLRLSHMDALRTSAALGEGVQWQGAAALRALVQSLQGGVLPEVPVPASVQAQLRPYQQQGLNWLQFLRTHGLAGVLADDMGLGKTLQTLAHIQVEKDAGRLTHPALIIAPVSLMGNWQREAARFCPQLRSLVLHGKDRHAVADAITEHDVVIAPYSLLQRDRARWLAAQWHMVVLDEAQNIKNAHTHAAQVVGQLQTGHRLCLSGTPMENHLGEIWSLFHFLMPGFLGSYKRFTELFRTPIEKQGNTERLAQLRARVTPFMLRRTKALVAHELPPKIETVVQVQLSGAQADLYETIRLGMEKTVREALASKGLAKSQITILDALLKLRQVCCDPRLLALEAAKKVNTSAKLEQLMEMLTEMLAEGRRVLLFSQFTTMLALIEAELKKRQLPWVKLTGQSQKRDQIIERFTSGEVPLFLISLKAGGVGLNLPQADTVIHYDPWWSPAVEQQATDRAHRIGQTQSVWVLKMVAQGTIEERILALQERKAQLAGSLYSETGAEKGPLFTESDVAQLLQPLFIQ